jgi:hypothetical protein
MFPAEPAVLAWTLHTEYAFPETVAVLVLDPLDTVTVTPVPLTVELACALPVPYATLILAPAAVLLHADDADDWNKLTLPADVAELPVLDGYALNTANATAVRLDTPTELPEAENSPSAAGATNKRRDGGLKNCHGLADHSFTSPAPNARLYTSAL